jgi:long-chain acyl-CoA synthetase
MNQNLTERNIFDYFSETADKYASKTAIIYLGEEYTYKELRESSMKFAYSLHSLGVKKGDRVLLYAPNCVQWVIAWLGVQKLGAVTVPITPIYTPHDIEYIANDSGAETIVCTHRNFGYVNAVLSKTKIKNIIVTNIIDILPFYKRAFGRLSDRVPHGRVTKGKNIYFFKKFIKKGLPDPPEVEIAGDDLAQIFFTGGTTKDPKGVPISHGLYVSSLYTQLKAHEPLIPWGENVVIQGGPLFHVLGQAFGLSSILISGDTIILLPSVNLDAIFDAIERYKVKTFFGVPALYRMILEHDRVDYYDLSSLTHCFSGGDSLPKEVANRWVKSGRFNSPIRDGYGATEVVGGVSLTTVTGETPPGSCGKVLPHKEIIIADQDTLKEVPNGEVGELLVHSDPMVNAYWNKPEESASCFVNIDGKNWYKTGDMIKRDDNDFLYFVDRTVDIIKHKGYRISASEIEATLQDHPAIISACVVGIPDDAVGERIKAFVVLKEDVKGITGHELIKWARKRLTAYKVPSYIEFRDMLPKSKVGKLLRRTIRSEEVGRRE